ncbi:MAG: hypothetical protein ACI9RM_001420 [Ulvibacter sp.]|jgi:hypothetical protein
MKLFILSILLLVSDFAYGQVSWEYFSDGGNTLSDIAKDVEELADGYIVTGNLNCPDSNYTYLCNVFLLKLDKDGNELWRKEYDFENNTAESIEVTSDGGFLIGMTHRKGSVSGMYDSEIVVIKTDAIGEIEWTKIIDNGTYEYEIKDLKVTPDAGGFILVGIASETDSEFEDAWFDIYVYKGNDAGEMEWEYFYGDEDTLEEGVEITPLNGGGYAIGGFLFTTFNSPNTDFLIIRITEEGNDLWAKTFTGGDHEKITSTVQAQDGNILAGGYWEINQGGDYQIMKIDVNTGEEIWSNPVSGIFGGPYFGDIDLTEDGGFLIGFRGNITIFKFDENGNEEWSSYSQKPEYYESIHEVKQTEDGGIIAIGDFRNDGYLGDRDVYVTKLTSHGKLTRIENHDIKKVITEKDICIYPNPVIELLIIESENFPYEDYVLKIYDGIGREILCQYSSGQKVEVDVSGFKRGVYWLLVQSEEWGYSRKVIKN